ncbi:DUF6491 family protein [Flavobacterium sp. MXW15]|uniref:DUF6491 family protein n=1 Tax=Xanthomonas chitinilytica TaxID=2989819 RepID=A0ABT3JZE3_9XANT|nr:DUF6491 family protein [Xanthomonas sp. H13-6]MCW4453985.1 DUF6491 family protein [Flavobacterium sp. MXW15]MCW4473847.1 DUF6491 family protein [Xanthomonas sp. H13-6]
MKTMLLAAALCLSLASCATADRLSSSDKLALYRAHAGEPVRDFRYFGQLNGWTELGDSALAVWTRPAEAWLLELGGPCMDLAYAPTIGVTNHMGTVSARFDSVIVSGGSMGMRVPCRIQSIRPLDVKALKASERELREARVQEREAASQE